MSAIPTTMQAAVYHGAHDVRIETVPVPEPRDDDVLVAVRRAGICGTDASEWSKGPIMVPLHERHPFSGHVGPMIPGHEFVGEVVAHGSGGGAGDPLPTGSLVASGAGVWCGRCDRCAQGRPNVCRRYYTLGLNAPGGLAEYVAVPRRTLRLLPDGLPIDDAALAQPLAVGLHAARRAGVREGETVVVIGAGAIGTFVLAGLTHLEDARVVVVDLAGSKLDRATTLGAARTIVAGDGAVEAVRELTAGQGADVVIEASGVPGQLETALRMVGVGGRVLAVGLPAQKPALDVSSVALREVTIDSTVAHVCDEDLGPALDILAEGRLGPLLIDSVVPLDDLVAGGLERLAAGEVSGKILIAPNRSLDAEKAPR